MNGAFPPSIELARLYEKTSQRGTRYFGGPPRSRSDHAIARRSRGRALAESRTMMTAAEIATVLAERVKVAFGKATWEAT